MLLFSRSYSRLKDLSFPLFYNRRNDPIISEPSRRFHWYSICSLTMNKIAWLRLSISWRVFRISFHIYRVEEPFANSRTRANSVFQCMCKASITFPHSSERLDQGRDKGCSTLDQVNWRRERSRNWRNEELHSLTSLASKTGNKTFFECTFPELTGDKIINYFLQLLKK